MLLLLGTYLVATRNIKPLEVIVDQYPVIHGPYAKPPRPQCLECYKLLEEKDVEDGKDEKKSRYLNKLSIIVELKSIHLGVVGFTMNSDNTILGFTDVQNVIIQCVVKSVKMGNYIPTMNA